MAKYTVKMLEDPNAPIGDFIKTSEGTYITPQWTSNISGERRKYFSDPSQLESRTQRKVFEDKGRRYTDVPVEEYQSSPAGQRLEEQGRAFTASVWEDITPEDPSFDMLDQQYDYAMTAATNKMLEKHQIVDGLPPGSPQFQILSSQIAMEYQQRASEVGLERDLIQKKFKDLSENPNFSLEHKALGYREILNKSKVFRIGTTTPQQLEKTVVTPQEKTTALSERIAKLTKAHESAPEGSPEETAFYRERHQLRKELAQSQGKDYLDVPTHYKGKNIKGVSALIDSPAAVKKKAQKLIEKYKERGLSLPWQLQSYDIGSASREERLKRLEELRGRQ